MEAYNDVFLDVLTELQEVEDNLAALRILSRELDQQNDAVAASQRALSLSTERYKSGIYSYLNRHHRPDDAAEQSTHRREPADATNDRQC